MTVFGREVDFDPLFASHDALFSHIKKVSNREELTFGEVVWLTEWRSVLSLRPRYIELISSVVFQAQHPHGEQVR